MKPLLWLKTKMGFFSIACREKTKSEDKSSLIRPSFSTHIRSSRKAIKRSTTLFPSSKERLHKLQFLQELSYQKPYWDHARLSSLGNKQVSLTYPSLLKKIPIWSSFLGMVNVFFFLFCLPIPLNMAKWLIMSYRAVC